MSRAVEESVPSSGGVSSPDPDRMLTSLLGHGEQTPVVLHTKSPARAEPGGNLGSSDELEVTAARR